MPKISRFRSKITFFQSKDWPFSAQKNPILAQGVFWWWNHPKINGFRLCLKMRQYYRTFCRTLGHPGQFLTVTDQLSYYLIIRYLWLAVPNGPIRISIANELRLNDLFLVTFFDHFFFRLLKIDDVITFWRHWFIFIYLF